MSANIFDTLLERIRLKIQPALRGAAKPPPLAPTLEFKLRPGVKFTTASHDSER